MRFPEIRSMKELAALIADTGLLPAFKNEIPGFSAEECVAPEFWFPPEGEGFWEWKGPVIRESGCAYGKFLRGRACFMTLPVYLEFANYRRDGYDYDALCDDGLARSRDAEIFKNLREHGSLLSRELKRLAPSRYFEDSITWLQMHGYAVISNFEYPRTRDGRPYGWGLARYETPEFRFGADFTENVYRHEPEESSELLLERLKRLLPDAGEDPLRRLLG